MSEELFPDLEDPYMIFQEFDPTLGLCEVVDIKGKDDFVFWIAGHE
jgi:hypothetical protein